MRFLAALSLAAALLMLSPDITEAQNRCPSGTPDHGTVCYLDLQLGSPHLFNCNSPGGCRREWTQDLRIPSGYVLLSFTQTKTGGFGDHGLIQCHRLGTFYAGDQVASRAQVEMQTAIAQMMSARSTLQAHRAQCSGGLCNEVDAEIQSVSRSIEAWNANLRDAMAHRRGTSLRCGSTLRVRMFGPGARWGGHITVTLRYVGQLGDANRAAARHLGASQQLVGRIRQQGQQSGQSGGFNTGSDCVLWGLTDRCTTAEERNLPRTAPPMGAPVRTTTDVRVRTAQSSTAGDIGVLSGGVCVPALACYNEWCLVNTASGRGYIAVSTIHEGRHRQLLVNGC